MRKSFKDSIKAVEADIQFANTLASDYPREYDGACLQMRLSYRPAAQFFWFLIRWTDCHLAGALGLLRILIYKDNIARRSSHLNPRHMFSLWLHQFMQICTGTAEKISPLIYLGVHGLNHAPSAGTVSKESTQVIFGSTPATARLLIRLQSLGRIRRDFLCTLISFLSSPQILHLFRMIFVGKGFMLACSFGPCHQ
ncbi:unnamed protein product [Malus baccata var. baccata]